MPTKNNSNEIVINRIYDAPVEMVWEAWTDPEQVGKWWGPRGFSLTTAHKNVKPGGTWEYVMHGPDGVDYPNRTTFLEVEQYSRLVYEHGANDSQPAMFRVSVNFTEVAGKTNMEMRMALPTPEAAEETRKFIKQAGGDATWDRLAEFLSPTDKFVINRSFPTSIDRMFDLWTEPNQLQKWVPPTGFSMKYIKVDIKPGGSGFYVMDGTAGLKMYGKANYIEITRPTRLVYTQVFCDENEKITRHPMAPTWPETMLTTVTFTAEGPFITRVTVEWEIFGEASDVERETFNNAKPGMTAGWTGSFDKLEDYIEKEKAIIF